MLNQPTIFKVPMAVSQSASLSKGCSSGYVTNVTYTSTGPVYHYCNSGFSCNPYGSSPVDASSGSDGWTVAGAISGVVSAAVSVFT